MGENIDIVGAVHECIKQGGATNDILQDFSIHIRSREDFFVRFITEISIKTSRMRWRRKDVPDLFQTMTADMMDSMNASAAEHYDKDTFFVNTCSNEEYENMINAASDEGVEFILDSMDQRGFNAPIPRQ